jgi:hypothetical protein
LEIRPTSNQKLDTYGFVAPTRSYIPDELVFKWNNLPPDSEVTMYFSDIKTSEIQALASTRRSPLACDVVDVHTLRLVPAGLTWIPIPGNRELNIPTLISIKLPDAVRYGQEYTVDVHQVSRYRVIGSNQFRIKVSKAELILTEEARTLSVFKHILTTIPIDNRWYPIMQRYVHHISTKVDALGGNAESIYGNPNGSGKSYDPHGECAVFAGKVCELHYDCEERFIGFTAETQRQRFNTRNCTVERTIMHACKRNSDVTICVTNERDV